MEHDFIDFERVKKWDYLRKILHFVGCLFLIWLYKQFQLHSFLSLIATFFFLVLSFEVLRSMNPKLNQWVTVRFKSIVKKDEKKKWLGLTFLLQGTFITALLFPSDIFYISFLSLAFADPIASFFGVIWRPKIKVFTNKSFAGFLACAFACGLIFWVYLYYQKSDVPRPLIISSLVGICGGLSEALAPKFLDDNLVFPVLHAIFLYGVFWFFSL